MLINSKSNLYSFYIFMLFVDKLICTSKKKIKNETDTYHDFWLVDVLNFHVNFFKNGLLVFGSDNKIREPKHSMHDPTQLKAFRRGRELRMCASMCGQRSRSFANKESLCAIAQIYTLDEDTFFSSFAFDTNTYVNICVSVCDCLNVIVLLHFILFFISSE